MNYWKSGRFHWVKLQVTGNLRYTLHTAAKIDVKVTHFGHKNLHKSAIWSAISKISFLHELLGLVWTFETIISPKGWNFFHGKGAEHQFLQQCAKCSANFLWPEVELNEISHFLNNSSLYVLICGNFKFLRFWITVQWWYVIFAYFEWMLTFMSRTQKA